MVNRGWFGFVLLFPAMLATTSPAAHPMHTTFTEIEQTESRGEISVTIRGFEDDLSTAAHRDAPKAGTDSAIATYLRQHALLTDRGGRSIPLQAVGLRRSTGVIWVSLRSPRGVDLAGSRFINRALTEVFHDQVNLVQVKLGGRSRTIMFTPGDRSKAIGD